MQITSERLHLDSLEALYIKCLSTQYKYMGSLIVNDLREMQFAFHVVKFSKSCVDSQMLTLTTMNFYRKDWEKIFVRVRLVTSR